MNFENILTEAEDSRGIRKAVFEIPVVVKSLLAEGKRGVLVGAYGDRHNPVYLLVKLNEPTDFDLNEIWVRPEDVEISNVRV